MSALDLLTADLTIKSWALHAAKDGKRMRYYLYISSNGEILKDCFGMSVRVDLMGETCDTPEQAIERGYAEFSRECKKKISRQPPPPKPIEKLTVTDISKMSAADVLKELGL